MQDIWSPAMGYSINTIVCDLANRLVIIFLDTAEEPEQKNIEQNDGKKTGLNFIWDNFLDVLCSFLKETFIIIYLSKSLALC